MRSVFLVPIFTAMVIVAPAMGDDEAKKDLKTYQGTWTLVSWELDGMLVPLDKDQERSMSVDGDKVTLTSLGGRLKTESTLQLDASKEPKQYDEKYVGGLIPLPCLGIYEFEGETLKMCLAGPAKDRPRAFATAPGSGQSLRVWKRVKP